MKLKIFHKTRYHYSSSVFIEPHIVRFHPKSTGYCSIKSFKLSVFPGPTGTSFLMDIENNLNSICWFDGVHRELLIIAESIVEVKEYNPFNFLVYPSEFTILPIQYPQNDLDSLETYFNKETFSEELIAYGERIQSESGFKTMDFVTNLTRKIHEDFVIESRETGNALKASTTYELKRGSCRDLAWMQIQLLRSAGIAARFVSGYYYLLLEKPEYELHAWLEVYLPGAGWMGFDPSHGIKTGNSHFPVSQSAKFENTMPVTGSIRGDAKTTFETEIVINPI